MNLRFFRRRPLTVASITSSLNIMAAQLGEHIAASQSRSNAIAEEITTLIDEQDVVRLEANTARSVQGKLLALCS